MSTRRTQTPIGEAHFDHGAQYFTVRDPGFIRVVADWAARGVAAPWQAAGADAWVGSPTMNAVIRDMALRHRVEFGFPVKGLVRDAAGWQIIGEGATRGRFDTVILAVPAEQAASILALHDLDMARLALHARSQPCWTAMFAFAERLPFEKDTLKDVGPLAWVARNNTKPGRSEHECWVVQANATWSAANLEEPAVAVENLLKAAFEDAIGMALPATVYSSAHRWRYALSAGTGHGALWNDSLSLGVCGDWLLGPRVECAWLSGQTLAEKIGAPMGKIELPIGLRSEAIAVASV